MSVLASLPRLNSIEPLQKLVRLKLEGRLPRSPRSPQELSFAENPAFPGGVFLLGGAEVDGAGSPGGGRSTNAWRRLHSFQNGIVSARVPGATAPRTLCWYNFQPPRSPAGTGIVQLKQAAPSAPQGKGSAVPGVGVRWRLFVRCYVRIESAQDHASTTVMSASAGCGHAVHQAICEKRRQKLTHAGDQNERLVASAGRVVERVSILYIGQRRLNLF